MNQLPSLSFLTPEVLETVMAVDEIDLGHKNELPLAPFKGSRFIVYPAQTSPLDVHDVTECWFVAAGCGILTYNGEQNETIKPGDVLYFGPRQSHKVYNHGTENLLIFSVWWNPINK